MSRPIQRPAREHSAARSLGASYRSQHEPLSLAEESIARDLDDIDDDTAFQAEDNIQPSLSRTTSQDYAGLTQHSIAGRRPSYMAGGPRPFLGAQPVRQSEVVAPTESEREEALDEERSLLRDNNLLPPKHSRRRASNSSGTSGRGLGKRLSHASIGRRRSDRLDEEDSPTSDPTESTALLEDAPYGGEASPTAVDIKWEEAILSGQIKTTWQRESKVLMKYSLPLMLTFILQNSLTLTSIFTVGHIGKIELGAVSLGSMTANITGYAIYHGLATSLDTLCAQAYGSGNKKLVGLQLQRMVLFLWSITVPISVVWFFGSEILGVIVPEKETARLAGMYLKVLIVGAPAYACFESGKRYVQAQGRFSATMYVLLICAPLNVFLHWLLVWKLEMGFIGCPIAVVITETLMPVLLLAYVRFFGGLECWPGLSRSALKNWGPMIRLALPGLVMVMAEFLAFEILTLSSSWISATHLAANTVLQSLSVLTYQLPFPLSIAASTRVANLIGAGLPDAAKKTASVTFTAGTVIGLFNAIMLLTLRNKIPGLFTSDPEVNDLAARVLPVNAAFQLFDSLAACCNGVLRGLGKQEFGGYASLFAYYAIGLPISFGTGFGLHWDLYGLWAGPAIGLAMVCLLESFYIRWTSWEKASEEAARRNEVG
nr:hypothetical protein B0A51_06805 [Rachicladosporium sp. CCFEE 5018]